MGNSIFKDIVEVDADLENHYPFLIVETDEIDLPSRVLHYHRYIEICYIERGIGTYMIEGKRYSFKSGDIFIIRRNEVHLTYNVEDFKAIVMLFNSELIWNGSGYSFEVKYCKPFWKSSGVVNHKFTSSNKCYEAVLDIIIEIYMEEIQHNNGYDLMIKSLLLRLSAILTRYLDIEGEEDIIENIKNYQKFSVIYDYIDKNYKQKLKLYDLARLANMSESYFSNIFKKTLHITPIEYIIRIRIIKASQLLLETDMKTVDVAEECGFSSSAHFIKFFKRYVGTTPKDYRK